MANPQPTDPHLRLAHELLVEIMSCDFTKRQLSIILLILRLSWGCGKKEALIPQQRDFEVAGVLDTHVKKELRWLFEAHVITIDGPRYWFNKDYDNWRVSRVRCHDRERLTKLVSLNLQDNPKVTKKVTQSATTQAHLKKDNTSDIKEDTSIPENISSIIIIWYSVDGFNLPKEKAVELATELAKDYPELDLTEESKGWKAYCMDHPLGKGSSPAQQLRNRMRMARKYTAEKGRQHDNRRTVSRGGPRAAGDFSGNEW